MTEQIRQAYTSEGLEAPEGKGIHSLAFHKCAVSYLKKGMAKDEAYKRCMGGLGRNASVKKAHRDPNYRGPNK